MRASAVRLAVVLALFAAVSRADMIDDVLSSLSRGADFLERQHEHINLDGVVGYLMLQGESSADPDNTLRKSHSFDIIFTKGDTITVSCLK